MVSQDGKKGGNGAVDAIVAWTTGDTPAWSVQNDAGVVT
jgi:hypothetical protein